MDELVKHLAETLNEISSFDGAYVMFDDDTGELIVDVDGTDTKVYVISLPGPSYSSRVTKKEIIL